jgi:hypothetical protein
VEGIGEFSDVAIRPRGRLVAIGGILHIESFVGAFVVELINKASNLACC